MKEIAQIPELNSALEALGTPTSLLVRGGGMLYSCGIPPLDLVNGGIKIGTIEEQTHAILEIMKNALEGAGSSMEKVVKTTIYITDNTLFGAVNSVYLQYFPNNFPARAFVAVDPWPLPFQIEIDCIAIA